VAVLTSLSLIWLATLSTVSLTLARGIPKKITRNYMLKPRVRIPPSIFTALTDSPLFKQRVLLPSFHPPPHRQRHSRRTPQPPRPRMPSPMMLTTQVSFPSSWMAFYTQPMEFCGSRSTLRTADRS